LKKELGENWPRFLSKKGSKQILGKQTRHNNTGTSPDADEPKKSPRTEEMSNVEAKLTLKKNLVKTDQVFCVKKEIL